MELINTVNDNSDLMPFTYKYYDFMLRTAISSGYQLTSFSNYSENADMTIILRHDIDYSLDSVLKFAKIEFELGITSTYCFRVHASEYNIFSAHVVKMIHELRLMNHEVGLHTEAMSYSRSLRHNNPYEILKKEKMLMELVLDIEVESYSEHRDVSHQIHKTAYLHDHCNVDSGLFKHFGMSPCYFNEMKFISDSNGCWREGDIMSHLNKSPRMQVLTHPEWWSEYDLHLKGPYKHGLCE